LSRIAARVSRGHEQDAAISPVVLDLAAGWQRSRDRDDQLLAATFVQQHSDSADHSEHERDPA